MHPSIIFRKKCSSLLALFPSFFLNYIFKIRSFTAACSCFWAHDSTWNGGRVHPASSSSGSCLPCGWNPPSSTQLLGTVLYCAIYLWDFQLYNTTVWLYSSGIFSSGEIWPILTSISLGIFVTWIHLQLNVYIHASGS